MIEFAQVHPVYFGMLAGLFACAFGAAIGAMFGAIWNSEEGGDALANPAAQDRRSHPSDQARAGLGAPRFDQLSEGSN